MTLARVEDGAYVSGALADGALECDAIIFDCDGVLIDITKSYDMAIRNTAAHVLEGIMGIRDGIPVDSRIIDGFKATGGFNDEVDLTYAVILAIAAAKRLGQDQLAFIYDVIANANSAGITSAEAYIGGRTDIKDIRDKLDYPGSRAENPVRRAFDQMFYGAHLYKELFGHESEFSGSGLIENDVVLVSKGLLDALQKRFPSRIAMVTGRGMESVRYSLKELLGRFNLENSAFLEDRPRELAKPNPESLLCSMHGMNSRACIYVGDSMEDLIMSRRATELGGRTVFCGITGTSRHPDEKLAMFERNGAQMVLKSINLLPKVLNLE